MRELGTVESHLVLSAAAHRTIALEAPQWTVDQVCALAHHVHDTSNVAASISSGSFRRTVWSSCLAA